MAGSALKLNRSPLPKRPTYRLDADAAMQPPLRTRFIAAAKALTHSPHPIVESFAIGDKAYCFSRSMLSYACRAIAARICAGVFPSLVC